MPLKLLEEGLAHSQQVYKGIYEFTNLVRDDSTLQVIPSDLKEVLDSYLKRTAYKDQVIIEDLPTVYINEPLFCTAIDNLIRNGLKYNDSNTKWVKIKMLNETTLTIIDNGRGMSQEQFEKMRQPYVRRKNQEESGSGLGLNICVAILDEHGFKVSVKKLEIAREGKDGLICKDNMRADIQVAFFIRVNKSVDDIVKFGYVPDIVVAPLPVNITVWSGAVLVNSVPTSDNPVPAV